jgi:very-short-patch-repair endonuclease
MLLDRFLIKGILEQLAGSTCQPAGGMGSRAERMQKLRARCDSKLEKKWLDSLDSLMLRPPSDAQYRVEGAYTDPDFYYREFNAAIYVDGPPHDTPDQIQKDDEITIRLQELGYVVIRFHHSRDDWNEVFRRHPDIFGQPQK